MNIAEWRAHRVVPQVLRHFLYLNFLGALAGSKIGWHFIIHEYYWAVHLKKQASNFFTVLRLGSGMGLGLWWWWWLWLWFWLWLWVLEWEPPYRWLQRDLHRQLFPHGRRQCRWAQRISISIRGYLRHWVPHRRHRASPRVKWALLRCWLHPHHNSQAALDLSRLRLHHWHSRAKVQNVAYFLIVELKSSLLLLRESILSLKSICLEDEEPHYYQEDQDSWHL